MKVRHALTALVQHVLCTVAKFRVVVILFIGVQSAPLWDAINQQFAGMFTVTDFINLLLHYFYNSSLEEAMQDMDSLTIKSLKALQAKSGVGNPQISIHPMQSLYEASRILLEHHLYRLPLVDDSQHAAVIVSVVTEFKILRYIAENFPDASVARQTLRELGLGMHQNLKTAAPNTPLITVLKMFVKDKISAVPIQDENGIFIDIYEKYDVLLLTKEGSSTDLSIPLSHALAGRSTEFAGIHTCSADETLGNILDTIRKMTVHRFIVLEDNICKGILSLLVI
ncbi:AMP-activated serine/threonine-protein kinase regulatory subunit [Physocladia obscura]|uniref:AMP-activated serine/threonine-protein kinase regulatory subunit n=1 Tax=Physocladia obscura TaxID=109957 RepID=A0AAD5TCR4_9FUNG|nr:AMP-activated serine/threonine-protein kinase regulatory subunit [Physocladia obscura]